MGSSPPGRSLLILAVGLATVLYPQFASTAPANTLPAADARRLDAPPPPEDAAGDFHDKLLDTGARAMAEAIAYLRDLAMERAEPIPPKIRRKLAPYFDPRILDEARYTTNWSPSVGAALRQFVDTDHYALAVTLDNIIIFSDRQSLNDLWLWAHELTHVVQYRRWGIRTFASKYLADHRQVEQEAHAYAGRVMRELRGSTRHPTAPNPPPN